jgi:hypothetical protein
MHPRMNNVWFVTEGQSVYTLYSVFFTLVLFMLRCFSFVSDKLNIPNTRQDYGIPLDKYILKMGTHHTVLVRKLIASTTRTFLCQGVLLVSNGIQAEICGGLFQLGLTFYIG